MRIKMLRNVLVDGQHCAAGEVVEVEERLAGVLVQWGRAEAVKEAGGQGGGGAGEKGEALGKVTSEAIETATRPAARRRSGKGEL